MLPAIIGERVSDRAEFWSDEVEEPRVAFSADCCCSGCGGTVDDSGPSNRSSRLALCA